MSDKPGEPGPNIYETMAERRARLLAEAAAVERDMEDLARIAAKYNLAVSGLHLPSPSIGAPALGVLTSTPATPDGPATMLALIDLYKSHPDSPYKNLTHASRKHYDALLSMITRDHGDERLAGIQQVHFIDWHTDWSKGGTLAIAHAKIGMVRNLFGFGTEVLKDSNCERLFGILCKLKYKPPPARTERLTEQQAHDIRAMARKMGRPSIALAQAFQSSSRLLQKDIIGEWVPVSEPGMSDITSGALKWMRGIRWNEIDENLVLHHSSPSWLGDAEINLLDFPMIVDELRIQFGLDASKPARNKLPSVGAIVRSEWDGLPWTPVEFRRWWRKVANACGVPPTVKNMDGRTRAKDGDDSEEKERRHAR
ncbi:hypothetical protein IVB14_22960 [Bradyrhizobium sp. 180]|uniref:hypothetical protein n=1 Tax=unclassified Bradyrhizobium TaxID=2631580 RepID=UPI001FF8C086|nr:MULTISPECIES: hypothetical protein [unclassified Bradyrhizobium]MCK1422763.1 hypothetical protein [Bradyrhizobium sp. CW12]MCK1493213.1 hypothetical protein [Bradyrhizobium sp. 180]MCK1527372.1 hypothetical protein [Bradyrhizobium sp. 182]MCK1599012.1 hypothetical protein [Bradyrhizobium sp. 164]MCK1648276.1 hypothetical protein [Bradyrhizobium sp. 154]